MDNKLELIESLIYLIGRQNLRIGLQNVNAFQSDKRFIFKPLVVNSILIIMIFRDIIMIYNKDQYFSKLLSDFSYNWDFGIQWKILESSIFIWTGITVINNYYNYKNLTISQIISTDLKLGYNANYLHHFRIINIFINLMGLFFGIQLGLLVFIYSFQLNYSIIITLFWFTINIIIYILVANIIYWNLLSFILYCFRSRILLNIENNRLTELIVKNKHLIYKSLLDQLKRLDIIYNKINNWNKIWSNFVAITLGFYSYSISFLFLLLFFGKFDVLSEIMIIFGTILSLFVINSLILIASSVNTESKRTYKLLSSLFVINSKRKWKYFKTFLQMMKVIIKQDCNSNMLSPHTLALNWI